MKYKYVSCCCLVKQTSRRIRYLTAWYACCRQLNPTPDGSWNLRNVQFLAPKEISSYGVACFAAKQRVGHEHDPSGLPVTPSLMSYATKNSCTQI